MIRRSVWIWVGTTALTLVGFVALAALWPDRGSTAASAEEVWTCSMHPQVRWPAAGRCPICGMELIPVSKLPIARGDLESRAGLVTESIQRRELFKEIRTVGKLDYSERQVAYLTARIAGRVDRVFADFTGIEVKKKQITLSNSTARTSMSRKPSCCWLWKRRARDADPLATHRRVAALWPNYRSVTLTTREPRNIDQTRPDYVGKLRLQDFITSGGLANALGKPLEPQTCRVFLCGNPAMVGIPHEEHGQRIYPQPTGVIELLEQRGFQADQPGRPGNIHFEKYW